MGAGFRSDWVSSDPTADADAPLHAKAGGMLTLHPKACGERLGPCEPKGKVEHARESSPHSHVGGLKPKGSDPRTKKPQSGVTQGARLGGEGAAQPPLGRVDRKSPHPLF